MAEGGCAGYGYEDYSIYSDEAGCEGCWKDTLTSSSCIDCKKFICKTCAEEHENKGHDVEDLITYTGHQTDELRVVMVGKTGNGKSSSGNTLFGKQVFNNEGVFGSITKRCKRVTKHVEGKPLVVIDTPGLFDTHLDKQATREELIRCLCLASPGLHACLLVLSVGRFTEEEGKAVDEFEDIFGKKILDYTILIFTKLDETNMTVEDFKKAVQSKSSNFPEGLLKLVEKCNNRFVVFNNSRTVSEEERKNAVVSLIDMIKVMDKEASSPYYTHEMFAIAEKFFRTKSNVLRRPFDAALVKQMKKMELGRLNAILKMEKMEIGRLQTIKQLENMEIERLHTIKENEDRKCEFAKVEAQMAELNERLETVLEQKDACIIM